VNTCNLSDAPERFRNKVAVRADCWIWIGARHEQGYGHYLRGKAHRFAYEHFVGPIPAGLEIDHLCRIPPCVNPAHLEAVTPRENQLRGYGWSGRNARKTHCPQGHPYVEGNLYTWPAQKKRERRCLTCIRKNNRMRQRRYAAERKARELATRGDDE
jgi:hypothetical protein